MNMALRSFVGQALRLRYPRAFARPIVNPIQRPPQITRFLAHQRYYVSKTSADEAIEEIQDQYATAKDEFEIAYEETEKVTVYAEEDRKAAREELDKLQAMFKEAVEETEFGDEVRSRVGQRIRELDNAVKQMEEMAMNQD